MAKLRLGWRFEGDPVASPATAFGVRPSAASSDQLATWLRTGVNDQFSSIFLSDGRNGDNSRILPQETSFSCCKRLPTCFGVRLTPVVSKM